MRKTKYCGTRARGSDKSKTNGENELNHAIVTWSIIHVKTVIFYIHPCLVFALVDIFMHAGLKMIQKSSCAAFLIANAIQQRNHAEHAQERNTKGTLHFQ